MSNYRLGCRHLQVFLLFSGMAITFMIRTCMSIALFTMDIKWSHFETTVIQSSFLFGYVASMVPSGYVVSTKSAHKLMTFGIFISSVLHTLGPWLSNYGFVYFVCNRFLVGLFQGCLMPCTYTLLSRWIPPLERARLGSFVINGQQFGTVVSLSLSGILASSSIGWPSIFYVFGVTGIIWSLIFYFAGADYPSLHSRISQKETEYINSSLGNLIKTVEDEKPRIPWKAMLTSVPMWALITVHCGHNWGFYTFLTEMPLYMKSVLDFDIKESGGVSALPYLAMWLLGFPMSYLSDLSLRKNLSVGTIRKISNSIGLWIPALAMIILCLVTTNNKIVLVTILVIAVGFNCGTTCGFQINHIDLSPNFAGIMMSITSGIGNVVGIIAPLICGIIVTQEENKSQWYIVFYITAAIYFFTNLVFVIFGKAEVQSWNYPNETVYEQRSRISRILDI